jgi:hypothetical protein
MCLQAIRRLRVEAIQFARKLICFVVDAPIGQMTYPFSARKRIPHAAAHKK